MFVVHMCTVIYASVAQGDSAAVAIDSTPSHWHHAAAAGCTSDFIQTFQ
jgi:hypothetical protein